jgi:hypothetical protein
MNVKFSRSTLVYLDGLIDILIEKGYFSFYESSLSYIEDIKNYIVSNIQSQPKYKAPPRFSKYGKNMYYITYKRNRQTTWYIFFTIHGKDNFLIRYITNNHVSGQHFTGL